MTLEHSSRLDSADLFSMLLSSVDGFTLTDETGFIRDVNDSYCRMTGYSREELLGMHRSGIDAIETADDVARRFEEIRERHSLRFQTRHRRKDGSVIDVEVTANHSSRSGGACLSIIRDISQQKKTETELLQSEERYRNIVECQTEFVDRYLPGGILTYVNPALARFSGAAPEELTGRSFFPFLHEDDRDECIRLIGSISTENPTVRTEGRINTPDGNTRWASWTQTGIFDESGRLVEYQAVGKDVTEQKAAETALRESEQKYRLLFECAGDSISVMDMQGRLLAVNPLTCNMLGYTRDELLALSADRIDAYPEQMVANIGRLLEKGYYSGETAFIGKDGETVPISVHARLIVWEGQNAIMSICRDIREKKLHDEKLKISEERFRSIAILSPDIISIINEDGTLAYNSPSAFTIHGYTEEEMAGCNTFDLIHPEDQGAVSDAFARLLAYPDTIVTTQYRYRNRDGSYTWMEATANNHLNNPHIKGIVTISRDISKRKQLEKELLESEQNLLHTRKIESLGVMAGGIAHDFNNILTGIIGNISYARKFIDASGKASEILQSAEKAAKRAGELSNQLLTFARGGQPVKTVVPIRHIIEESVAFVLHGSNVSCRIDIQDGIQPIDADEGQISQALHNIILNAAQAMPDGGMITVTAQDITLDAVNSTGLPAGRYLMLTVADKGCGIPKEYLNRIFDPYFTTKTGGSGLGLATTHSIITRHGGRIGVVSAPDGGTVFEILLPASEDSAAGSVTDPAPKDEHANLAASILVMDDEEIIRDLCRYILEDLGYCVATCENGEEAIDMYRSAFLAGTPYSAVIMDLTIPGGMGGKEAAAQILTIDPEARLIVSSGYSSDPIMAKYRESGFCEVLKKPFGEEGLADVLRKVLTSSP